MFMQTICFNTGSHCIRYYIYVNKINFYNKIKLLSEAVEKSAEGLFFCQKFSFTYFNNSLCLHASNAGQ